MAQKHESSLSRLVNPPGTLEAWTIAHENSQKSRKQTIFVMLPKYVSGLMGLVNHLGTLKLCAIAHENGQKWRKR